jgi:hypothetical protein
MKYEDLGASNTLFIDVEITVQYVVEPLLEKKPRCPDSFTWDGRVFQISTQIMEWVDNIRRGRMARNMSDAHSIAAASKGSWGVGRFFSVWQPLIIGYSTSIMTVPQKVLLIEKGSGSF